VLHMPQSGQEMLEESIELCNKISDGLATQNETWETSIVEIVTKFNDISNTFFFKTMPSVPATKKVLKEATDLLELKNSENWDSFSDAINSLISTPQTLIEKAGMKGTILT
jgi:hypothetical protein